MRGWGSRCDGGDRARLLVASATRGGWGLRLRRRVCQAAADGVELGIAPERVSGRQAAQAQHQPVGSGVEQQAELVGGRLAARGAVGGEVELVRLDQVLGLPACAIDLVVERLGQARQVGDDEAVSAPWGPASMRPTMRRSTVRLLAA
jgi:hypothetical protein